MAEEMDEKERSAHRKDQSEKLGKLIDEEIDKVENNLNAHERGTRHGRIFENV